MTIEKTTEHLAAAASLEAANSRLAAARTAHASVAADLRDALAVKQGLIDKSAGGETTTADEIRAAANAVRDAEQGDQYSKAGIAGAESAQLKAVEKLRIFEQLHFKTKHRALRDRQAEIAREADAALETARGKLRDYDSMQAEFHGLRVEAIASPAGNLWPAANAVSGIDPLPMPLATTGVSIRVVRKARGDERAHPTVQAALGH